jgi:NADPH2:quinone reductase
MQAISISEFTEPKNLTISEVSDPQRESGELLVETIAAGVNFIDTYQRQGLPGYQKPLPLVLGLEGAGRVLETDKDSNFKVGEIVAWPFNPASYAEKVSVAEQKVVRVSEDIDPKIAAAVMLQGLTAHYLSRSTFPVTPNTSALVHAGSGGVGRLLVQMIKNAGGKVIATASTEQKRQSLEALGVDHAIDYKDFDVQVSDLTENIGVDVVFDGVGKDTFMQSLKSLKRRGLLALFGASSGAVPAMDLQLLNSMGSLFITRPTLADYIATHEELETRSSELFRDIQNGKLKVEIGGEYPLADAAQAHLDIESRNTSGKLLLIT